MPEHLMGNMWELLDDEHVTGKGGTIHGYKIVRVHEFPEQNKIAIQSGSDRVEIEGLDFETAVLKD